ncbi:hypothetical protein FHG87_021738 [Trinorchestia longiramus]|nr:hypothetical protein FHG87_021738 [Trinorchestia longiramus]
MLGQVNACEDRLKDITVAAGLNPLQCHATTQHDRNTNENLVMEGAIQNHSDLAIPSTFFPELGLESTTVSLLLSSTYQLERVKEAAAAVERARGRVIGSIRDNHKVNQQYCKLFERLGDYSATAKHPLDNERVWFIFTQYIPAKQLELHLQNNCTRNNWISEKGQKISLDNETTASFADVKQLYESNKGIILTTITHTQFDVNP